MNINGIICPGFGIASKGSEKKQELESNVFPDKRIVTVDQTVYRQFPFFIDAGVTELKDMYPGTINIDISPYRMHILKPDHEIVCEWIEGIREAFWLTHVTVCFEGREYPAYVYYPRISKQHAERDHIMELIAPRIEGITYGKELTVTLDTHHIEVQVSKT